FYRPFNRWFDTRFYPVPEGVAVLATDITERKRIQDALESAHAELRQMNQLLEQRVQQRTASLREAIAQMEEFSYSVSHDLRAPVRAMNGIAKAVLEDYGDKLDTDGKALLERIVSNSTRMDR